jgi:ABC transporter transmembrane region
MASEKGLRKSSSSESIQVEEERPKPSYAGLYRFCKRTDAALLVPAVIVSVLNGLLVPAFTILLGKIFTSFGSFSSSSIAGNDLQEQVTGYVIGICIVGAAAWALGWAHMSLWLAFGENTAKRARESVIKGLLAKNITWYDNRVVDSGVSGAMNKAVKYTPLSTLLTVDKLTIYKLHAQPPWVLFYNSWSHLSYL